MKAIFVLLIDYKAQHPEKFVDAVASENTRRGRRRQRQIQRRYQHRLQRAEEIGDLSKIFTFNRMYKRGKECCNEVRWKPSVQKFEMFLFSGTARRINNMLKHKWDWKSLFHFIINERGKTRPIDAPHIDDRQPQKVLTQDVLLPLYQPMLISNNCASMKGKGLQATRKEVVKDLIHHYNKYGLRGHVIVSDCSKYFPSADRNTILDWHKYILLIDEVCKLADSVVESFPGDEGVPLGVEPSQMEMIVYPSKLDTYMKCQVGLESYGHYMDDYIMLIPPELDPYEILDLFLKKAEQYHLKINKNKTHVIEFGKPFKFCKTTYQVLENGKVLRHGDRNGAKRFRHKMKSFKRKIDINEMTYEDVWQSAQGVLDYYDKFNDHGRLMALRQYFYKIYQFSPEHIESFRAKDHWKQYKRCNKEDAA